MALKTCKTQTGAILSLCWAREHGMTLMVQDLTNPMLAQIPHLQFAAHAGTIMGVETNAMQFYPAASAAEERRCTAACTGAATATWTGPRSPAPDSAVASTKYGRALPDPSV